MELLKMTIFAFKILFLINTPVNASNQSPAAAFCLPYARICTCGTGEFEEDR